ncbi:Sugar phosphatase YidA [compost metagenome]
MRYDLVAIDIDGTLINDDHELTQGTIEVIQQISQQGVEIVLCTGRAPKMAIPIMKEIGLTDYIITHNGAATIDVSSGEIVNEFPMNTELLSKYIDYCHEHGIHYDLSTTFDVYVEQLSKLETFKKEMYRKFLIEPQELPELEQIKQPLVKLMTAGSIEQIDLLCQEWPTWNVEYNIVRSGEFFVDMMDKDASKGAALKALADARGFAPQQVMAIGNYYNDITMLTYAGLGVAVDNAPVEVKAAANVITATNNDEGVKIALQKYCLQS